MGKYPILNSDTWGCDVLYDQNISSQMPAKNIRRQNYFNIQKDNISKHSFFITNWCNWLEPSSLCDQVKFNPKQTEKLSLSIKQNTDQLLVLIENTFFCGSLPDIFHRRFRDICNVATEKYVADL